MLCVCTFSFGLSRKKKIPKRKGPRLRLRCYSDTVRRRRGSNSLRSDRSPLTCAWQCLRLRTCAYAGGLRGRVLRYGDGYVLEVLIYIGAVMSYIPIRTERTSHYDWSHFPLGLNSCSTTTDLSGTPSALSHRQLHPFQHSYIAHIGKGMNKTHHRLHRFTQIY